jgi:Kelch motif
MKATPLPSPNRSQLRRGTFLIALGRRLALPLFFFCAALLVQPCAATPFHWEYTGSLNTARTDQTATLLTDGRVLVAGGYGSIQNWLASAELYDTSTGNWTVTGSLNTARSIHTATLLSDGRVLVAGGSGALASAELYDPAGGIWSVTGNLNVFRLWHTATLLTDGRVLVAGGDGGSPLSVELYDPAMGTWTVTASLNTGRYFRMAGYLLWVAIMFTVARFSRARNFTIQSLQFGQLLAA